MQESTFKKSCSLGMLPMNLNNKSFRLEGDLLSLLNSECDSKKTVVRNIHHIYQSKDGKKGPTDYKSNIQLRGSIGKSECVLK